MSFLIPSSSDTTSNTWPIASSLIFLLVMMIGIGQKYPSVSSFTSACMVNAPPPLNEQIHAALLRLGEIPRDAGELIDALDQRVLADAHQPHGRRAGDEADTEVQGRFHELRHARHLVLLHDFLHHFRANTAEMKTGKRQILCASL